MAIKQTQFPDMINISGVSLGTACAGIKRTDKDDLLLIKISDGAHCAAVFTRNAFCAAPVTVAKRNLAHSPRWLLINSGNANAGTGRQGLLDTQTSCQALASLTDVDANQVLPFSTGVIGEPLPVDKIVHALPDALDNLATNNWHKAAHAIMTTDTFAKGATLSFEIAGQPVSISGIAKGAGMIQPNMATMLAFIATDANIPQTVLQRCLQQAVEQSFNRITVDGDTSTNDACVVIATARSKAPEITCDSIHYQTFRQNLTSLCQTLAETIVRDGEGATKLIRIDIKRAASTDEALQVAKTIAHSLLVKTAFFASDPNWGRILAAVGRAGIDNLQINNISIDLGKVRIVQNGGRADNYTEQAGQEVMNQDEITITVALNRGNVDETVLTCDLSYDYVRINAEYRT